MRIYLSGRYGRRAQLSAYAEQLALIGAEVTSRWLTRDEHIDDDGVPVRTDGSWIIPGRHRIAAAELRPGMVIEDGDAECRVRTVTIVRGQVTYQTDAAALHRVPADSAVWVPEPPDWELRADAVRARLAAEAFEDIRDADTFVLFTERPRTARARGARLVELGYALALRQADIDAKIQRPPRRIVIVGPRENSLCWATPIEQHDTWADLYAALAARVASDRHDLELAGAA